MTSANLARVPVLALTLIFAAFIASAQPVSRVILPGHVPASVSRLAPIGRLESGTELNLAISLPLHNLEALTNLLEQIYDPASPQFHHYLAPDEFDARFGPTEQDYQAWVDFAGRKGLAVTGRHPNRMLLELRAPAATIEAAFQVTLQTYAHPTEKRTFFAPGVEPSVDARLPIAYISGLNNYSRPHPQSLHRSPLKSSSAPAPQLIGSGPNGNLAGFDYRAAYVPGTALTGAGQSVGLVEFDGYYPGDITAYENQTGLPGVPLQNLQFHSFNGTPGTYNGEVALDIEMAISMAPGLARVVVYEDDPNNGLFNTVLQAMSTNTQIKQFSSSWAFTTFGSAERTTMDNYFLKFAAQGQTFFEASGDAGAYYNPIQTPQDDPYITVVGGTTLATAGPGGPWLSEIAWNAQEGTVLDSFPDSNLIIGSGGGISTTYSIPTWQRGVSMSTNHGSSSFRNSPDVAMVAENIFIVADNGQQENTSGTSASAPLWAGLAALINQQAVSSGSNTIGFINPALYNLGTNFSFNACFDDIVLGNNTNSVPTQFIAVPGYDLCTGLGSPNGGSLINALTKPDGFIITPGRGSVGNGPVGGPFSVSGQSLSLTNIGQPAFNWSAGCTSTWLSVSANQGSLASNGTSSVTLTVNSLAHSLPAGVYAANVWFTNLTSNLAQLRQFTLQVSQELVSDGGFEAADFSYWTLVGPPDVYTNDIVDFGGDTNGVNYFPNTGNYFAAMGESGALAYLSQTLPTRVGQKYLLSFWLANPGGTPPTQFQVQWNPNNHTTNIIFNQANLPAMDYSNFVFTVQATTNQTTLKFGARNDADFFMIDDVSVIPQSVPVPTILSPHLLNGSIQFSYIAVTNVQYQVQYRTNLVGGAWINLGAATAATTNPTTFTDLSASSTQRFYRVILVP